MRVVVALTLMVAVAGCVRPSGTGLAPAAQDTWQDVAESDGGDVDAHTGGAVDAGPKKTAGELACERWADDRKDLSEGKWDGAIAGCLAGSLSDNAIENTLRVVNLYRFLAALPPVVVNAKKNADAQACALLMRANKKLSHTPPKSWKCWTSAGAAAAKKSNISTAPAVRSVDRYMIDSGSHNAVTLGHRRWILSRTLGPIGVGSTASGSSCLHVIGGKGKVKVAYTPWPPAGPVPLAAMRPYKGGAVDHTGWSVQSDSINLNGATVKVTTNGSPLPVKTRPLKPFFGSKYALAFVPSGWKAEAGRTYKVEVGGIGAPFSYEVEVLGCK